MQYFKLIKHLFFILFLSYSCSAKDSLSRDNESNNKIRIKTDSLVGKTLPDWQEGYLDIHAINTGRGECTFFIFPDGTTMLVDASSSLISSNHAYPPPPKPIKKKSSGQIIVDYIHHFMQATGHDSLNYIVISHFHPDHMGGVNEQSPSSPNGHFKMGGVTEVGVKIPFEEIIDRGYPDYDYPYNLLDSVNNNDKYRMNNYVKFIKWTKKSYGAKAEKFEVGVTNQLILKHQPSKYLNFYIRNVVCNGVVWTGKDTNTINTFPSEKELIRTKANENIFSDGFKLTYGKFDYFTAGDLQYNDEERYPWKNIEVSVAKGMTGIDVMKADHHGTSHTNNLTLLKKLSPAAVIINTWRNVHPRAATLQRFFRVNDSCNIFTTNMTGDNKRRLGSLVSRLKSLQGHVVVRVQPGGNKYTIYVLDDTNEKYEVKKAFGPYESK